MSLPFWCVVANVVDEVKRGLQPIGPGGTKHFAPGALLYLWPVIWGDGGERVHVVGRHRGGGRYITIIMDTRDLTNFRVKQCFTPRIEKMMDGIWEGRPQEEAAKLVELFVAREKELSSKDAS